MWEKINYCGKVENNSAESAIKKKIYPPTKAFAAPNINETVYNANIPIYIHIMCCNAPEKENSALYSR
jgi:hypothetical protein